MNSNIGVTVRASKDISLFKRLIATLRKGSVAEVVGEYILERLMFYSPQSLKDGWVLSVSSGTASISHKTVPDEIVWYLEYGTTAHRVEPKNARVLHWVEDGVDYYSMGHVVSGIKPGLFIARAFDDAEEFIKNTYSDFQIKLTP